MKKETKLEKNLKADKIIITKKQWDNLKAIAGKLDGEIEKLNWDPLESCPTTLKVNNFSNKLWKEINRIDGIKW